MAKINVLRVILAGLLAGIVLIVAEIAVERLIFENIPGLASERDRLSALSVGMQTWGPRSRVVHMCLPFAVCIIMMWAYAAVRPRFGPGPETALITSLFFICYWGVMLLWLSNMGLIPVKRGLVSFLDNLIVLPIAIVVGASIYKE